MILSRLIRQTIDKLRPSIGDYATATTERMLMHELGCSRSELYLSADRFIDNAELERIDAIVERCQKHEPIEYVLGETYFFDREFMVTPAVLLPRPDTELLGETVLRNERADRLLFADIGTGSGIVSCILTEKKTQWRGVGIDISASALGVARHNSRTGRLQLVCSDLFSGINPRIQFDLIVSNPPYIPTRQIGNLDESVRCFEPLCALDGGADGLDFYRRIATEAPHRLRADAALYCEIGHDQETAVRDVFITAPWHDVHCYRDLAGHPRVISARIKRP